jgi:endonuclease/exonuclease/phosphatase (EEP) superfamily protein YafD
MPPADTGNRLRVLLGDFNATLDHEPLRELLATGYRDAAAETGSGLRPTWPANGRRLPPVTIDHVLADERIGFRDYATADLAGTDHRPVAVTLVLPGG